jgi:Ni,Fe-hydrogenase III small subunit
VPAGGCSACAQSALALLAPRYSGVLAERGIRFTHSPRHADVILVTGTVTGDSLDALRRYLGGAPQPRALVAVGDCAIDGGVFAGAAHLVQSPAEALDVNVEIAGCPPSPESILAAISEAVQLLDGDESDDAEPAPDSLEIETEESASTTASVAADDTDSADEPLDDETEGRSV